LKKKLAIFSPGETPNPETFIQAHKNLPFNIRYYYGGWIPTKLESSPDLLHFNLIQRIKKKVNKKFNLWEYALINSLKKEKVDCVLAEYGLSACETLNVVKFLNIPLIVHFFGFDATVKSILEQYRTKYQEVFSYATSIVVVSEKMKYDLINLGCPPGKITLTYCGPDESFFKAKPHFQQRQFLSIGRFVDKKAPYFTIAAFKQVALRFPDARLIMIGDGILLNTCKNLSKLWSIEQNIDFMGVKTPTEIFNLFQDSLAFVQHSITADNGDSEGTPVAILDAQAAGLPVISTYHAGIKDVIVNNETGLLVEERDVDGMAKNMLRILEEKGLAAKFGVAGRHRVKERFSMEIHLRTLESLILAACRKKSLNIPND
jgi:colanic acid/amylovoran biosynthesis glycosyltransferase